MFNYLLVILLSSLNITSVVHAQDFTYEKAYQDYVYTQSQYIEKYSAYQKAKDNYQKNQTLSLKETAREKTYDMLISREELLRVYLIAVKMRIFENKGLTDTEKAGLIKKIDTEIEWLKAQKDKYKSTDPAEDLFNKSKETQSRYKTNIAPVVYESLFNITYGDLMDNKNSNLEIYTDLKKYIEKGVSEGRFRIDPFNRWFTDIENVEKEMTDIETKAKARVLKIYSENYTSPKNAFDASIEILGENIPKINQLNNFVFELLNAIRAQVKLTK